LPLASPLEANAGSELPGFEVVRRLGKGGTSLALEVWRRTAGQPRQGVLKTVLEVDYNERLAVYRYGTRTGYGWTARDETPPDWWI
jgi:hypothetical protein